MTVERDFLILSVHLPYMYYEYNLQKRDDLART